MIRLTQGVKVTIAGSFINFSLGIFYAWSVFAGGLIGELGWSKAAATRPYTLELLAFSITMIFAGRFPAQPLPIFWRAIGVQPSAARRLSSSG
ncbi:MAG: hypothetical protein AB1767_08930 [Bacillota bacterium]